MALFDGCGGPIIEGRQLLIDSGNGRVFTNSSQPRDATGEIIFTLRILRLLRREEIITSHDINRFF